MCRFLAYLGPPIVANRLLLEPEHSLIRQSRAAMEMEQPLNGDGFGLGWYVPEVRPEPGLFRSVTPAWSNQNLLYNASLLRSECIFAHVRAATEGGIAEQNCHPFHYRNFLLMHNGGIPEFGRVKRSLIELLDEDLYLWIHGQTDTEHMFALFIQTVRNLRGGDDGDPLTAEEIASCFQTTFDIIEQLVADKGITRPCAFNTMITDGLRIVGTRYSTDIEHLTPTLYCATGSRFECVGGRARMVPHDGSRSRAALIVSERLTRHEDEWIPIPPNHCVVVHTDRRIELTPMKGAR
jgi:predicted glutamine amidotransferase